MWLTPIYDEQEDLLRRFAEELRRPTGDGAKKRSRKEKPPWYIDPSHEAAVFSHLMKWKKGELVDPDSGAHPLVHAAWRLLAIACQETGNVPVSSEPTTCEHCGNPLDLHVWKGTRSCMLSQNPDPADGFA